MADHLVVGLTEVVVTCGNLSCQKRWIQPVFHDERIGWLVCPHCNFAAPTNVARDLRDDYQARPEVPSG